MFTQLIVKAENIIKDKKLITEDDDAYKETALVLLKAGQSMAEVGSSDTAKMNYFNLLLNAYQNSVGRVKLTYKELITDYLAACPSTVKEKIGQAIKELKENASLQTSLTKLAL